MADKTKKEKEDTKKKGKKGSGAENEDEEKESFGSKFLLFIVTVLIIAIWLGIFGILIKFDVGGFGSTVLYPILKDVPVVNKILPDVNVTVDTEGTEAETYDTLDEALARIKELELELDSETAANESYETQIADLNSQISELTTYKENQAEFEAEKEKFYEEVVFSDNAPDINEYKTYYESIDPENAEVLYKQVVEQTEYDSEVEDYAKLYSSMKAKDAAEIFDTMTDNLDLVADILDNMSTQAASDILAAMDADTAAKVTEMLEPSK